jgi:hypothetical protein
MAELAERGMSGSTQRGGISSNIAQNRNSEINRIRDQINQQVMGADERFTDKATGVMERRTDSYPDLSWLTGAAGQMGGLPQNALSSLFGGQTGGATGALGYPGTYTGGVGNPFANLFMPRIPPGPYQGRMEGSVLGQVGGPANPYANLMRPWNEQGYGVGDWNAPGTFFPTSGSYAQSAAGRTQKSRYPNMLWS